MPTPGIQMFPDADGNYIARNTVYGNGDNISFGGDSKDGACASSDDNIVERNILSHPRVKENVGSWSGCGKHGTGNVLRENCIWPPRSRRRAMGFALVNNFYVEPAYVNAAAKDFRIVPGTVCAPLVVDPGFGPAGGGPRKRAARKISLQSNRRWVRIGGRLVLSGSLAARHPPSGSGFRCDGGSAGSGCAARDCGLTTTSVPASACGYGTSLRSVSFSGRLVCRGRRPRCVCVPTCPGSASRPRVRVRIRR